MKTTQKHSIKFEEDTRKKKTLLGIRLKFTRLKSLQVRKRRDKNSLKINPKLFYVHKKSG
jgi:type IV secretory pathway TrbF-like protein